MQANDKRKMADTRHKGRFRPSRCTHFEPSFSGRLDICTFFKQHLETKSSHHKEQAEIKDVQAEMGNMQLLENNPFQGGHISLLHR